MTCNVHLTHYFIASYIGQLCVLPIFQDEYPDVSYPILKQHVLYLYTVFVCVLYYWLIHCNIVYTYNYVINIHVECNYMYTTHQSAVGSVVFIACRICSNRFKCLLII